MRIAVIGAGIAGLSAAYHLQKKGFKVVVYEKNKYVGGRMASRSKGDLVFDIGADHLCDLYDEMKKLCKELNVSWNKVEFLKYGIFKDGKIISHSEGLNWRERIKLALYMWRQKEVPSFFHLSDLKKYDTENAYNFMNKKIGSNTADYIVDSFTSTYQFHRAREMSKAALIGITYSTSKQKERWHLHYTKGGMSSLPEAMAKKLNVKLNHETKIVEAKKNKVKVDNQIFDCVVLACPATKANSIYKNPTIEQKRLLESTKYSSSISVSFTVDLKRLPKTAIVWCSHNESKIISGYVNESMKGSDCISEGKTLINCWLHSDYARKIMNNKNIYDIVAKELERICPWLNSTKQLKPYDLKKWDEAMPEYYAGFVKKVATFEEKHQGENNVYLCGDYMNSPWTEGALRCGQRVAKEITKTFQP